MTSETNTQTEHNIQNSQTTASRPNENGSVHVDEFIKIFDPATHEVYLETRA